MGECNGVRQVFSERLRELREAAGLTQQELAEKLNWSRGSISFYEKCQRCPDIEFLKAASTFFGVSADWFIGQSDVKSPHADIQAVCAFTGLSETSVGSILRETANEETRKVLNIILSNDTDAFHRIVKNAQKGIFIHEKYMNKPFNWELIPGEIRQELFDYFDVDPEGFDNPADRTRERYFNRATNYLKIILLDYLISPDGKPMIKFDDDEEGSGDSNGID